MSTEEMRIKEPKYSTDWILVLWYLHLHFLSLCAIWLMFTDAKWMTIIYVIFVSWIAYIGVTIGAHRYYAHQTFTATTIVRLFFVIAQTIAGVGSIYNWVLLHRIHHKYFRTEKDPYNCNNGFIYSHFISNCTKGYLEDTELVKSVDMRDVDQDRLVWLQHKFYWLFYILLALLLPIDIPMTYWNESLLNSCLILGFFRFAITTNISWLVNSAIIVWGLKPTDKFPVDDASVFYVNRSYWQNYHYIYPRDWKSSEFGQYNSGCGTMLLKFFKEIGLINMLRSMSSEDAREALYKIAIKKKSVQEALVELEKLGEQKAIREKLRYVH